MTTQNTTPLTEIELNADEHRLIEAAKPKAKAKAKPKKKAAKRNVITKAMLEVQVEEMSKKLELAQNKADILFSEKMKLREKNQVIESKYDMANGLLIDTVQNAFNMYMLATKK